MARPTAAVDVGHLGTRRPALSRFASPGHDVRHRRTLDRGPATCLRQHQFRHPRTVRRPRRSSRPRAARLDGARPALVSNVSHTWQRVSRRRRPSTTGPRGPANRWARRCRRAPRRCTPRRRTHPQGRRPREPRYRATSCARTHPALREPLPAARSHRAAWSPVACSPMRRRPGSVLIEARLVPHRPTTPHSRTPRWVAVPIGPSRRARPGLLASL